MHLKTFLTVRKKLLKILQICNKAPFPPNDGSSIAIYNMARGFILNNAELHLLTINTKKHFKPDENLPGSFKRQSHYQSVYKNTDTSPIGAFANLFSSQSYFVSRFHFSEFEQAIVKKLQEHTFDIIQLEGLFVATYLDVIRRYSKAKVVLRAHNVEYLIWERHIANEKSELKKKYLALQNNRLRTFEEKIAREVDAIVSITDVDADHFRKMSPGKPVFTCITGVDTGEYIIPEKCGKKPNTVFSFASMDWMPNQEAVDWFLENCWGKILKEVPDCKFIIAGRNMPARFLNTGLPNVLTVEKVPDSKEFYGEYGLMVVPLLSGSGLRIKIIEGMAYGKPIVSTRIGAEGIRVNSGANIVLADQPDDFANAVITLLQNKEKKESMSEAARRFAEQQFENKNVVEKLVQFYKTLHV